MNNIINEKVIFLSLCFTISFYYFTSDNDIIIKKKNVSIKYGLS